MRTTQRAIFRKCTKNESLIYLRFEGVKRRHALYRSYRSNCDRHNYFLKPLPTILNRSPYAAVAKKKYEKPVILDRYGSSPSVADCIINKGV